MSKLETGCTYFDRDGRERRSRAACCQVLNNLTREPRSESQMRRKDVREDTRVIERIIERWVGLYIMRNVEWRTVALQENARHRRGNFANEHSS